MIVPANRGGSVEHFYHFLFGYLLPFLDICHPLREHRRFLLRDCGPMNRLLRELDGFEIALLPTWQVLGSVLANNPSLGALPKLVAPGFDAPAAYDAAVLRRIRALVPELFAARLAAAAERHPQAASDRLVLMVDRAPQDPFYASPRSEKRGAGAQVRSIPNMAEIHAAVAARYEVLVVRLETLPFFEQVYLFSRAWRVVGQHGAGLAHMIWAREDAALVEAIPSPNGVPIGKVAYAAIFRGVCSKIGVRWHGILQEDNHVMLPPARVLKGLAALD
ncbi:glycosyltransferase family 61 protein [Roseomonas fluvialis]|uniref:Glycosyltransferase 61 catalytic domain-containing protein n=1 Tax=Roseomonas fluvialis TaxID=1750527 RepID=A0ABN6P3R5_9PROT|nr:glycosyltransferase family 61 protein [Roseomonas fluvialis]BDG73285.1 hypothetical protein Rmf_32140 [Roseomonas fluvialis]